MRFIFPVLMVLFTACNVAKQTSDLPVVITSDKNLDQYVGELVTLKGEVSNSKITTILGVDVEGEGVRGKQAIATGILEKTEVKEEDVDIYSANRGAGTFYLLRNPETKRIAVAKEI